ncbi:MerR family transcriptional regulator [Caldithrix abyssi]
MKQTKKMLYPIGMVAKMFNISVSTIRLYENEGLIIPIKSQGQHRYFTPADIQRLECIRDLIEKKGLNFAGIRLMLSTIPCWDLKPCTSEDRLNCDAYYKSQVPCWMVAIKGERCKNENCVECPVYQESAQCANIKVILKKYWRTPLDED